MDDILTQMGQRIRKHREESHMTQTISTAETGKKRLRPENIVKICTALGVSADYLLLGKISPEDIAILSEKVSKLTPAQYRHLEDIIDSYVAAVTEEQ